MKALVIGANDQKGIGRWHVRELLPHFDKVQIYTESTTTLLPQIVLDLRKRYQSDKIVEGSSDSMPDAVVIASPTPTHLQYLERYSRIPTLVEKPLGSTDQLAMFRRMRPTYAVMNAQLPYLTSQAVKNFNALQLVIKTGGERNKDLPKGERIRRTLYELLPHVFSLAYWYGGEEEMTDLKTDFEDGIVKVSFDYGGRRISAELSREPERGRELSFTADGKNYERIQSGDNQFLRANNSDTPVEDPLKTSVRHFRNRTHYCSYETALKFLEWQIKIESHMMEQSRL